MTTGRRSKYSSILSPVVRLMPLWGETIYHASYFVQYSALCASIYTLSSPYEKIFLVKSTSSFILGTQLFVLKWVLSFPLSKKQYMLYHFQGSQPQRKFGVGILLIERPSQRCMCILHSSKRTTSTRAMTSTCLQIDHRSLPQVNHYISTYKSFRVSSLLKLIILVSPK